MKKTLLLIFSFISILSLHSQTSEIVANPGTSGVPGLGTSNFVANESIYTETEIGAANFVTAGTAINRMGLSVNTLGTPTTFNSVNIYFKEVPLATTTFTTGTYTTAGYTLVFSGNLTFAATGFTEFNLTTPFTRTTGNNLQVLIERTDGATHAGFLWNCANGNHTSASVNSCRRYNGTTALSGTTSLAVSVFRAAVRFIHQYDTDASVNNVYTLGKLPIPNSTPHSVSANIRNPGKLALTNLQVTLNVTGANTFSNTQTIASLASGASAVVTFLSYTPTVAGNDNISVTLPADDYNTNNTMSVTQNVNINSWTYAYGTVPTSGVGFNGATGDFVAKFNTNAPTAIPQVSVNFSAGGQPYKIGIWDASGVGGTPGVLLGETSSLTSVTGVNVIPLTPAIDIPAGNFYVGVRQTGIVNVNFSYQAESPIRASTFFFASPTGSTTWTDFAPNNSFRFMIEPKLQLATDGNVNSIVLPHTSTTCEGSSETVNVTLTNAGLNEIAAGTVLTLNVAGPNPQTITTATVNPIPKSASAMITFTGVNYSNPGTNITKVYISIPGDLEKTNDTVTLSHITAPVVSALPVTEDFETLGQTYFKYTKQIAISQPWVLQTGPYSNLDQTVPLAAHSGTRFFRFNAYDFATGSISRLYSDCMQIPASGGCIPELSFYMSHDNIFPLNLDSMYVSISTNQGATWQRILGLQRFDATFTSPGWKQEIVDLSAYAGMTIQIGFEGVSKFGNSFGLDDITIGGSAGNDVALETTPATYPLTIDCEDLGWTYYNDAADRNVLAIEWGTNLASKAAATVSLTLDPTDFSVTSGSGPTAKGTFTMKRYWNVDVNGVQLGSPVNLRFFYDALEKASTAALATNFQSANPGSTLETPTWFKTTIGDFMGDAAHVTYFSVNNSVPLTDVNAAAQAKINNVLYAQFNGITSFSGGGFAAGVGPGTPLPISIEYFTGIKQGNDHLISWKANCVNSSISTFEVQRSVNGRNFVTINSQTVDENGCKNPLSYLDLKTLCGLNYYRLKITDASGTTEFSEIITLVSDCSTKYNVFPSITNDLITIDGLSGAERVNVLDAYGKTIMRKVNVSNGQVNLSNLISSMYILQIVESNGDIYNFKIMKQ